MVNRMLMRRSAPQPRSKKTPIGGMKMAKMILMMSDPVKAIVKVGLVKAFEGWLRIEGWIVV